MALPSALAGQSTELRPERSRAVWADAREPVRLPGGVRFSARDFAARADRSLPEPAGATLIGAAIGAGLGVFMVVSVCDAPNCVTHPDTRRTVLGSTAAGAFVGYLVDVIRYERRSGPEE